MTLSDLAEPCKGQTCKICEKAIGGDGYRLGSSYSCSPDCAEAMCARLLHMFTGQIIAAVDGTDKR
jgi:hypothetical protein